MRDRRYIITGILLLAVLFSCEREKNPWKPAYTGDRRIEVKPDVVDEDWLPTRAMGNESLTTEMMQDEGFGVYAYYTGFNDFSNINSIEGLVLNNRQFYYDSGWKYVAPDEYWPTAAGEKLTFFAYAPWSGWNDKVSTTGDVPSIQYDDYVAQSLTVPELEKQRDILWGTNTSGMTHKNVNARTYANEGVVDMHFRHAVAKVNFAVRGSLPGETPSTPSYGAASTISAGNPYGKVTGTTTSSTQTSNNVTGSSRNWTNTRTETETETRTQIRYRSATKQRTANYNTQGYRYFIEYVTFKGFNQTGTLLLDNTSAYDPSWTNVRRFTGTDPEYVLNGDLADNALSPSLRYVGATTIANNYGLYTGVTETPVDLMSERYLYAVPRTVSDGDRIQVGIKYHRAYVDGRINGTERADVIEYQTRTQTRVRTRTRIGTSTSRNAPNGATGNWTWQGDWSAWSDFSTWTPADRPEEELAQETGWGNAWYESDGTAEWTTYTQQLSNATVNYNDDPAPTLSGEILTPFQGGRAYTVTLILAGDKIELEVVPRPWRLEETTFDYTSEINDVIQALTYDSSYIDYADADGNVYINNRMGKFYFRLGRGKYIAWQASLVGDAAFGFTDENGNFLVDGEGRRVSSVRGGVDPDVTNYLYVRAINSSATVTSRAKLRIYYIDSDNNVTAALNLVNLQGVNEWTIVQNAN